MNRILILCIFIFKMSFLLLGQTPSGDAIKPPSLGISYFRDDISPQVSMMNLYGTYPVDLSNGLVDVSIPLYTIKTTGLTMPLGLSFHASGLKSNEREGLLGVRWVLTGGGYISRIIRGYPDDGYRNFNKKVSDPEYTPDFYDLYGAVGPQSPHDEGNNSAFLIGYTNKAVTFKAGSYQDTEHDIYSYSLPSGKNGKFLWRTDNENGRGYTMPYEPIKVSQTSITDENGVVYRFGENYFCDKDENDNITTWYLTSIISANKQDTILIDYVRCGERVNGGEKLITICDNVTGNIVEKPDGNSTPCNMSPEGWFLGEQLLLNYYREHIEEPNQNVDIPYSIKSINVRSGGHLVCSVNFDYDKLPIGREQYIREIIIKNAGQQVVKHVQFTIKKNAKGVGFLDKLTFLDDANPNNKETYAFDYYNQEYMPKCGTGLSYDSDWWGFYSSGGGWVHKGTMNIYPPDGRTVVQNMGKGDKAPRFESTVTGMIKSIRYPTGGRTTFEYESNGWYDTYQQKQVIYGGLRIKNVINRLSSGKIESKYYEYGTGYIPFYLKPPTRNWIISENEVDCFFNYECAIRKYVASDYVSRTYHSSFPSRYTDLNSNIVTYDKVTEYNKDETGNILGKIEYKYALIDREFYSRGYYENVGGQEFTGRLGYQIRHISPKYFWKKNLLVAKSYFKGDKKVKENLFDYRAYEKESIYDLPVYRYRHHYIFVNNFNGASRDQQEMLMIYPHCMNETFAFKHQEYVIGAQRLTTETEKTYNDDGTVTVVVKEIEYDPTYLLPVKEVFTNSDNAKNQTVYLYPFSQPYSYDEALYGAMVSRNILSPRVEEQMYMQDDYYSKTMRYKKIGEGFYINEETYSNLGSTITYHNYTSTGRPVYMTQNNGTEKVVYLWSYFQQHPIAEIRNVTYDEVCRALGGESFITSLADKIVPSSMDYTAIHNLRSTLPNAQITTAKYRPLVGVIETTDPKGLTTYYEYDGLGKLIKSYIRPDLVNQTIEQYDYHYINQ